jgi:hypothetical protein
VFARFCSGPRLCQPAASGGDQGKASRLERGIEEEEEEVTE